MTQAIDFTVPILRDRPTAEEPLRGLPALARVALMGAERIRAEACRPRVYAWHEIVERGIGQVVGLVGPPGHGKTELAMMLLAARMHVGEPLSVLGREVTPAPIGQYGLAIEAEHGEGSASRRYLRAVEMVGASEGALGRIIIIARKNVLLGDEVWQDVAKLIAAGLVSDVLIDSLARVARADANDEQAQAAIFDELHRVIESSPAPEKPIVWLVAHTRKKEGEIDITDMSGSAQRVAQLDVGIVVTAKRDSSGKVTSSTASFKRLREGDPDRWPDAIEFAIRREGDRYVCEHSAPQSTPDDLPLEDRIVEILRTHGRVTKNRIRVLTRRNKADIETAITSLFAARRIRSAEVEVKGTTYPAFELRHSTPYETPYVATPDV